MERETEKLDREAGERINDVVGSVEPFVELCECDTPLPPDGREGERLGLTEPVLGEERGMSAIESEIDDALREFEL